VVNETTKRLIARVKQIRLAQGLTQEQFAERADLDPKYYQHAEAGRKPNPGMDTLLKLAKGTGLELWQLLNFDDSLPALAEEQGEHGFHPTAGKRPRKAPKRSSGAKAG
jgi:transcriptional regulator with XRE-family HTH domain